MLLCPIVGFSAGDNGGRSQAPDSPIERNCERIERFIEHYRGSESVTIIEVKSAMTKLLASNFKDSSDASQLLSSIESIVMMVDTNPQSDLRSGMLTLPQICEGYELITSIKSGEEQSLFYFATHESSDRCEFLMLIQEPQSQTLLSVVGVFTIRDIAKLSQLSEL